MSNTPPIDIEQMHPADRLRLIEELWDSLGSSVDAIPLSEAQKQELDRRLDAIDAGDDMGIPWEDALARLREPGQ
jgi:putative addiction module component (TIGR02574 family)